MIALVPWMAVVITVTTSLADGSFGLATVDPMDISSAHVGDSIAINCSFVNPTTPAPPLYIKKESDRIQCDSHHFISPSTWQLRLQDMDQQDSGRYFCYTVLPEYANLTCGELNNRNVTSLSHASVFSCLVAIDDTPQAAEYFRCVMEDFGEKLTCEWCDGSDSSLPNRSLNWTLDGQNTQQCINYGLEYCSCNLANDEFHVFEDYTFTLTTRTDHGTHAMIYNIATDAGIAQAGKVINVHISATPHELQIDWDASSFSLQAYYGHLDVDKHRYVINISSEWGDFNETLYVYDSSVTLDDLEAYTFYHVKIQAVIHGSQYPGKVYTSDARTDIAVPSVGPSIVAYRELTCTDRPPHCRHIVLYWQDIPPRQGNGPVQGLELSHSDTDDLVDQSSFNSHEWKYLSQLQGYNFSIRARNAAGWSPWSHYSIPDHQSSLPDVPDGFLEYWTNNNTLLLHLSPAAANSDRIFLLSCQPNELVDVRCKSSPSLQELPNSMSTVSLDLPPEQHVYGLMAVAGGVSRASSGLEPDWLCNYRADGEPALAVVSPTDAGPDGVTLNLALPQCHQSQPTLAPGRVVSYVIHYGIESCTNDPVYVMLPGNTTRHRLKALLPGETYGICVTAVGPVVNRSLEEVTFKTLKQDHTGALAAGLSVLGAILVTVVLIVVFRNPILRYIKKLRVHVEVPAAMEFPRSKPGTGFEVNNTLFEPEAEESWVCDKKASVSSSAGQNSDSALGSMDTSNSIETYQKIGESSLPKSAVDESDSASTGSSEGSSCASHSIDMSGEAVGGGSDGVYFGGNYASSDALSQTELLKRSPIHGVDNLLADDILKNEEAAPLPSDEGDLSEVLCMATDSTLSPIISTYNDSGSPPSATSGEDSSSGVYHGGFCTDDPHSSNDLHHNTAPDSSSPPLSSTCNDSGNSSSGTSGEDSSSGVYNGGFCTDDPHSSNDLYHNTAPDSSSPPLSSTCNDSGNSSSGTSGEDSSSGVYHGGFLTDDPHSSNDLYHGTAPDSSSPPLSSAYNDSGNSSSATSDKDSSSGVYHGGVIADNDPHYKPSDSNSDVSDSDSSESNKSLVFSPFCGYYVRKSESCA